MTKNSTGGPWPHQVVRPFSEDDAGFALRGAAELELELVFAISTDEDAMTELGYVYMWADTTKGTFQGTFIVDGQGVPVIAHRLVRRLTTVFASIAGEEMEGRRRRRDSDFIRPTAKAEGDPFARERLHGNLNLSMTARTDKIDLGYGDFWSFAPDGGFVAQGIKTQVDGMNVPAGADRFWLRLFEAFVAIVDDEDRRVAESRRAG